MAVDDDQYDIEPFRSWNEQEANKRYFPVIVNHPTEPIWVRQAPNKVCVLGTTRPIDPAHVRLHTELIGQNVKPNTILADSEQHPDWVIHAHMLGILLEINTPIISQPNLLIDNHMDLGFIALIKAKYDDSDKQLEAFFSQLPDQQ